MMDPTVKVAIIVSVPPTITALATWWSTHRRLATIEINTNHRLDKLLNERNAATTRADHAEGRQAGVDSTKR